MLTFISFISDKSVESSVHANPQIYFNKFKKKKRSIVNNVLIYYVIM